MEEREQVLAAVRGGAETLPRLKVATGLDYGRLQVLLHNLEFEWRSVRSSETPEGFKRYRIAVNGGAGFKGTDWKDEPSVPPAAHRRTVASVGAVEAALVQRDAPFCVACQKECRLAGNDRNGRTRWRCRVCDATFLGTGGMNRIKSEKREAAISLFNEGKSAREVARTVGMQSKTAQRIRKEAIREPVLCGCGRDAGHGGRCSARAAEGRAVERMCDQGEHQEEKKDMRSKARREAAEQIAAMIERGQESRAEAKETEGNGHKAMNPDDLAWVDEPEPEPPGVTDAATVPKISVLTLAERFNELQDKDFEEFLARVNETAPDGLKWGFLPDPLKFDHLFCQFAYGLLISLLDSDMSSVEQDAIWLLIRYVKKQENTLTTP